MKRLQKIYQIRPVKLKYYTYNGEQIRNPIDGYVIDEEITKNEALNLLRLHRNNLLLDSDWTQLVDSPLTDEEKILWRLYRQNLRDFPQYVDINLWVAPSWPLAPGETETITEEIILDYPTIEF